MKTPKEYVDNLNKGIITKQMLSDCLYSCNKRAKNCRDKERDYRERYRHNFYAYDKYDTEERYRKKKDEYYAQKDALLAVIQPICIHKEGYDQKTRVYDYEEKYDDLFEEGNYFHSNSYYDKDLNEEVFFIDTYIKAYRYYLFYDLGLGHTFHTPIESYDISKYDLPVVEIDELTTFGDSIERLVSNQFTDKVLNLIRSGNYKLVD